jgi:hypothetical protein
MCECGCVGNDDKYSLPGPGESFYLVSLSVACENCDAPPGITIERLDPACRMFEEYATSGMYGVKPLTLNDWTDGKGVAIVTGMRKDEFVKAMLPHLIGVDSRKLGENGVLDECGAEVIAEEMYANSWNQPAVVPCKA